MDRFLSRKFIISIIIFIVSTGLTYYGKISSSDYVDLIKWLFVGYVLGNNLSKFSTSKQVNNIITNNENINK